MSINWSQNPMTDFVATIPMTLRRATQILFHRNVSVQVISNLQGGKKILLKTDPSEIERTYNIRNCRLGFIESIHENSNKMLCPKALNFSWARLEKAVSIF